MKIKLLACLGLIIGMALTPLYAQNGKNETGSFTESYEAEWEMPVFCDGVLVDVLQASLTVHHIGHYLHGDWLWCYVQCNGTAISSKTGEEFIVKEIDKQDNNITAEGEWHYIDTYHFNARGSDGTHYIGVITLTWEGVIAGPAVCN